MEKYADLGLEASKFIEDLNMYEASKDGLFRVDRGAGNNPEFEETRRVFATKMAKIHLQQQQLLQEDTLPRGSRGPVNGAGRLGPQPPWEAGVGSRLVGDGAAKPPIAAPAVAPGTATTLAAGQLSYPLQEPRARPYGQGTRQGGQDCGSQLSTAHQPGPCEDPSCLTHGDYYDNLSLPSPKWDDAPGVSPGMGLSVGSGWPGPPGGEPRPKPCENRPLNQPQLSLSSGRPFESGVGGQDGSAGGRRSEKPAGLWSTASSQRVSPGQPSLSLGNGTSATGPTPLRPLSVPSPSALSNPSQGALPRADLTSTPTADPQPWFQDGPKSHLSGSVPSSSLGGVDSSQLAAVPGLGPKPSLADLSTGPKLSPTGLVQPAVSALPEVARKEGPPGWSPDGSLVTVLPESPSSPKVRLPCQTLVPGPELGPSAAELKLEALTQRLEQEMDAHPKADYFGEWEARGVASAGVTGPCTQGPAPCQGCTGLAFFLPL